MYPALPSPSRRASPADGSWWSIFGRIAASQPVWRPNKCKGSRNMANANKRKGSDAERAVRDYLVSQFGEDAVIKTRAGFNDDAGDILVDHQSGRVVLQVKNTKKSWWTEWLEQTASQVEVCRSISAPIPVVGGVVIRKRPRVTDPAQWLAVTTLGGLMELLDAAYESGWVDGKRVGEEKL